jgi:hypothetical protein
MSLEFRPSVYLALKDSRVVAVIGNKGDISMLSASLTLGEIEELTQKVKTVQEENLDITTYERDWDEMRLGVKEEDMEDDSILENDGNLIWLKREGRSIAVISDWDTVEFLQKDSYTFEEIKSLYFAMKSMYDLED